VAHAGLFFTPAFFIVRSGTILQTTLHSPAVKAVLRGINPTAAGMIIAAGITIVTALLTPTIAEAIINHHLGLWAVLAIFLATALAVLRYGGRSRAGGPGARPRRSLAVLAGVDSRRGRRFG